MERQVEGQRDCDHAAAFPDTASYNVAGNVVFGHVLNGIFERDDSLRADHRERDDLADYSFVAASRSKGAIGLIS